MTPGNIIPGWSGLFGLDFTDKTKLLKTNLDKHFNKKINEMNATA